MTPRPRRTITQKTPIARMFSCQSAAVELINARNGTRRFRRYRLEVKFAPRLLLTVVAGLVFLSPAPSRAGGASYADPAGDATAVDDQHPPRSSDPELDLLNASWSTTADELVVTTSLTALGSPVASDGWAVAHYFDYEGIRFEVLIQDVGTLTSTAIGPDGVYLRIAGDNSTEYPCVCGFSTDANQARVTVRVELHSLGSAVRFIDPSLPRPRAGSRFTGLSTTSYRVAGFLLAADKAVAPEGTSLVV